MHNKKKLNEKIFKSLVTVQEEIECTMKKT